MSSSPTTSNQDTLSMPRINEPTDVLVRLHTRGVSSSDIGIQENSMDSFTTSQQTLLKCHGSVGFVVDVGSSVSKLKPNDIVAVESITPCARCTSCTARDYTRCICSSQNLALGSSETHNTYVFPEEICTKLPSSLSLYEGALVEPLAVAINLVRESNVSKGNTVVVFGANLIGILCCILIKSQYVTKVIVVDVNAPELDIPPRSQENTFIMSQDVSSDKNAAEILERFSMKPGVDIVINASGNQEFLDTATKILKLDGNYVQAGMKRSDVSFDVLELFENFTAKGNVGYAPGGFGLAVDLLEEIVNLKNFLPARC